MKFKRFTFNILRENTYVLYDENCTDCAIIDPGMYYPEEEQEIIDFLNTNNLIPSKILFTHCHLDHLFGARFLKSVYPLLQFYADEREQYFIDNVEEQGMMFGLKMDVPPSISHYVFDGEKISFAKSELIVLSTPGHSPGGVCFYSEKDAIVFSGDALFANGIGRTDLHGGSYQNLIQGIQSKLMTLPETTQVFCGHGPQTTIGEEKHSNPYIQ